MKYAFMNLNLKRGGSSLAFLIGLAALILLICYALSKQTTSPLVSVTQGFADLFEGFASTTSPKCPSAVIDANGNQVSPAYKFFTDPTGESLCCAGTVNPLTHKCTISNAILTGGYTTEANVVLPWNDRIDLTAAPASAASFVAAYNQSPTITSAKALCSALPACKAFVFMTGLNGRPNNAIFYNSPTMTRIPYTNNNETAILYLPITLEGSGLCAFRPGVPDPRDKSRTLALCATVQDNTAVANGTNVCPPSLPKYAASATKQSCCKTATNLDETDCAASDIEKRTFCRINATGDEPDCATMRSYEKAVCPPGLQKISYTLGSAESQAYPVARGLKVPLCFGIQDSCFPDDTVVDLRNKGVFTREPNPNDPAGSRLWKYACGGYAKLKSGDPSNVQTMYVTPRPFGS